MVWNLKGRLRSASKSLSTAYRKITQTTTTSAIDILDYFDLVEPSTSGLKKFKPVGLARFILGLCGVLFLAGDHFEDLVKWTGFNGCRLRGKDGVLPWIISAERRPCVKDQPTLIEWTYTSGEQPKPERHIFYVADVLSDGTVVWIESIQRSDGWSKLPDFYWLQVSGMKQTPLEQVLPQTLEHHLPVLVQPQPAHLDELKQVAKTGLILRRINEGIDTCQCTKEGFKSNCAPLGSFEILEFLVLNATRTALPMQQDNGIYLRWLPSMCGEQVGASPRVGAQFRTFGSTLTKLEED